MRITGDPAPFMRRLEKLVLMLRYFGRFPRRHGAWPKYEYLKPWIAALDPKTVVDVGVNRGQFLILARRLFPDARIVGIEPQAALYDRLARIYRSDPAIRLHDCACGAVEGDADFYVMRNDQNSSLMAPGSAFVAERPGDGVAGRERVAVRRLDALLADCAGPMLVKIDVQGGELAVLEGMGAKLDAVAAIIVESPFEQAYEGASDFDDIYRFLTANGFSYQGALGQLVSARTGRVRQEDSVYLREPD